MGLSRLDNFLKSVRGTILYVDPNSLDSTDSIENKGNSLTRPFKTIQRALIEAARFSYQRGLNNDRFGKTTILVYPGDHIIDNRPGWIPDGSNNFRLRTGQASNDFPPFEASSNFDLSDPNNALYKLNSIHGGVIVPRGTSLVGLDLRKTKIRPKYVPNPVNDNIERSTIFRVTGGCYFWQFSMFDADPSGQCYIDYTDNLFVPNFSHHKLTCFEYADGVNNVSIDDEFQTYSTDRTDLDMYYEKIGLAYGAASGRSIEPDYPSTSLDIEPKIDEYRIVGSTGLSVGISSIRAGNGINATKTITVDVSSEITGLEVDSPIRIEGISADGYNGSFIVSEKVNSTRITYQVQNAPSNALPSPLGSTLSLSSDTVTSASPYIFNISLRSVYGMCGVLADGSKASGFKSMVIAQFTGIGLQKDDNAFVVYDETTGTYQDNTFAGNETISTNSRAIFKPEYKNFHIKCVNDAFIQNVSIFAIGYAEHFVAESGGDQSVTNSNSNFGAKSLVASGFRTNAFPQDDFGYITHIIPPKELPNDEISVEFSAIDVATTVGVGTTNERLYLYNETNSDVPPQHFLEGYRIGARENDSLKVLISVGGTSAEYSSRIVMPNSQTSYEKSFAVGVSSVGISSIGTYSIGGAANVITLTAPHTFQNGETVRVFSDTGELPDGLTPNTVYYAITSGLTTSVNIKLAKTLNDAKNASALTINSKGGALSVVSRVSDKNPGDIGHPIQYDAAVGQWYVKVSTSSTDNTIRPTIVSLGTTSLGSATARTYFSRRKYNRNATDTIYRVRYVIPASVGGAYARPPSDGFIIQESNNTTASTSELQTYFGAGSIANVNQQRNFRIIAGANWSSSSNTAKVSTEIPHNLKVGAQVEILNIRSAVNPLGAGNSGFNGTFTVAGITSAKEFVVPLSTNPGTFANNTAARDTTLPYFKRKRYNNTYYVYRNQEAQKYVPGKQDGIYYLTLVNASNSPTVAPFTEEKYSQPVKELYPQVSRDNPVSDPDEAKSFASSAVIGEVVVDDVRKSITKETITKVLSDTDVGVGLTNIISSNATSHTIHTSIDHGLNRITKLNTVYAGVGYGQGGTESFYNVRLVGFAGSTTGNNATAKITVNPTGNITAIQIMDGGSAYGIGNTLSVVGVATTSGFQRAVFQVSGVYNNVGDTVRISGVSSISYKGYNDLYRITNVAVGSAKSFTAVSTKSISGFSTNVGASLTQDAFVYLTGKALSVSNIRYNNVTGFATVTASPNHGLSVGNKIRLSGATQNLYNGDFVVTKNVGLSTFIVDIGISTSVPSVSGTIFAHREGVTSNDGVISADNENLTGRMIANYAGITTTLLYEVSDEITDEVLIRGIDRLDVRIGDYLQIDDELVRVKTTVSPTISSTDPVYVFRGVLGSRASKHVVGSVVRKVSVTPIEFRRHSIIRASGHTFEYVGFGPGNYSTAFPDKQDRQISAQEELLAQSTRREGGINFYTGMNDKGISYSGNKKLSTVTGQEEIFDTPIQTVTGDDIGNQPSLNVITPVEGNFLRSIKVEGGFDGEAISEFNGPVIFGDKVTSTSAKGFEVNSLFLQGDAKVSRKYTIGENIPTVAGNPGDVQYNATPRIGENAGWIYTTNNEWNPYGWISDYLYGIGISNNSGPVGFSTLLNLVGIGLTISKDYDSATGITTVYFEGDPINTIGISSAGSFIGNANALNFLGSKDGFGFDIRVNFNPTVGLATIRLDAPIDIIDFKISGDGNLGYASPSFGTTSLGSRIIYENQINATNTNYAVGIGADDSLWWSVPQNNSYNFKWYGGTTEVASLSSNGTLTILGNSTITAGRFISTVTTGTSPISVASSTLVSNLNANYLDGFVSAATTSPNTIVRRDSSNNINGNVSHLIHNLSGAQRGEWYADIPSRLGYSPFNRAGDTSSGICTFTQISDIYVNRSGSTLTCDFTQGPITRTTSTNVSIINITNVPTTDARAMNYSVIMNAATTVSNLANIQFQINGTALNTGGNSIRWLNDISPTGTAAGYYFFGFSIFRVGSVWEVLGVFATYA
jgi:hypothetical protein